MSGGGVGEGDEREGEGVKEMSSGERGEKEISGGEGVKDKRAMEVWRGEREERC